MTTEPGFQADRAVYNVVRGRRRGQRHVLGGVRHDGYFCSAAAKPLIEAQGFRQLFPPSKGGVCGQPTQNPTTNLTSANVTTTTTVTVTSASASSARIVAAVTGSSPPSGTVAFFEGATLLQSGVPLASGQAVRVQTTAPGTHTYKAVFTPAANTAFTSSEGTGTGTVVKATSSISASFPKTVKFHKKAKGTVTVTLNGSSSKATGTVTIKDGSKVVGTGTLSDGKVTITLKKPLKPGKHKLTVSWAGDANAAGSETKREDQGPGEAEAEELAARTTTAGPGGTLPSLTPARAGAHSPHRERDTDDHHAVPARPTCSPPYLRPPTPAPPRPGSRSCARPTSPRGSASTRCSTGSR